MSKKTRKKSGFDGLIVTIGLVLIVMILIFIFKEKLGKQVSTSVNQVATEVSTITNWNTTP